MASRTQTDQGHFQVGRVFRLRGKTYPYFQPDLFDLNDSERVVEVSLGHALLTQYAGRRILEVGHTLTQYVGKRVGFSWDVVDKHEGGAGVTNCDVVEIPARFGPYDLIVSLSTLEHVGFNEYLGRRDQNPDPHKFFQALGHLKSLLAPGGLLAFTVPLGYNDALDPALLGITRTIPMHALTYLERDRYNLWSEVSPQVLRGRPPVYGAPYPNANVILYATYQKLSLEEIS